VTPSKTALVAAALQAIAIWTAPLAAGGPVALEAAAAFALALVHALVALGLGLAVMRRMSFPGRSPLGEGATACSLGMGVVGLGTLVLGLVGLSSVTALRVLMTVLSAGLSPLTVPWLRRAAPAVRFRSRAGLIGLLLGASLISLLALHAATPPRAYDVLAYHLAVPRVWLREGAIFPMPGNFFSHQPFAVEMNFLVALALGADRLSGVATWLNIIGLVGVLGGVFALGRSLGLGRGVCGASALFVSATPLIFKVCTDALVDIWVVLGVVTAVHAFHRWLQTGRTGALSVGALALGFLATVKHPATLVWSFPLLGFLLGAPWWRRGGLSNRIGRCALVALVAALPVIPWFVKEWAWTGNPIFPLAHGVLGGEGWSEAQDRLLVAGHGLRSPLSGGFWVDAARRLETLGPCPLSLLLGACALAWRRGRLAGATLTAVGVSYLVWNLLAGSADRFVAPAVAILVPLGLGGLWTVVAWARRRWGRERARWATLAAAAPLAEIALRNWLSASAVSEGDGALMIRALTPALIAMAALLTVPLILRRARLARLTTFAALIPGALLVWTILVSELSGADSAWNRLAWVLGQRTPGEMADGFPHLQAHRFLNEVEHPQGRVLLVAEARTFNLEAPAVMGTVFDGQPLRSYAAGAADLAEVQSRLHADGVSHVLVNFHETFRLTNTYFAAVGEFRPPEIEPARPLWDFPTPLGDEDWRVIQEFHRWANREAIWRRPPWAVIARVPGD
jgi:hypothetical protein